MAIPVQPPRYGPYNQTSSAPTPTPVSPSTPMGPTPQPNFDMNALMQAFLTLAQNQGEQRMGLANMQNKTDLTMAREAQSGRHLGMSGIDVADEAAAGPWGGPLKFPSVAERQAEMAKYPRITAPGRTDVDNPYFVGAIGTPKPVGSVGVSGSPRKGKSFGFGAGGSRGFNAGAGLL